MNILILGGTKFIGRHIVETLLGNGHAVTIFTRGKFPDELPAQVERLHGDRDAGADGIAALKNRSWDACIDVSGYTPRQVRPTAELLVQSVGRYIFIATGSVYSLPMQRPVDESHPRYEPISEEITEVNGDTYGPLKVTCEDLIEKIYANRFTTLRPQIVAGPHDPTGRYTYWVYRAAKGGNILAPGDGTDFVQVIDVRDLARFATTVVEKNICGAFNIAGPRMTWVAFMQALGITNPTWIPTATLESAGMKEFEVPLFRPTHTDPQAGRMDVNNQKAVSAGMFLTPPASTARDTREWIAGIEMKPQLSPEREAELLAFAGLAGKN